MIDRINLSEEDIRSSIHIVRQVQLLLIELEQIKGGKKIFLFFLFSNTLMHDQHLANKHHNLSKFDELNPIEVEFELCLNHLVHEVY